MEIPKWLNAQLNKNAFDQVEAAIAQAEKRTSGEIVPIIIKSSSTTDHVSIIVVLITFACLLLTDPIQFTELTVSTWLIQTGYAGLAILLSGVMARSQMVQRALVSPSDRNEQVYLRAKVEFFQAGLNITQGQTGILIFVSMLEKQVVVLADKAISDKLPESTWEDVVSLITTGIKNKSLQQGLCEGIRKCGDILEGHFPVADDDVNEVKDHLIILE
jgi:putative membrane protein